MNNEIKKVLFIVNKYSGLGFQPAWEGNILRVCEMNGADGAIEYTEKQGHATELAQKGIGVFDTVIAVGGDGTVNEVARGLLHSPCVMGIIPKGSGNGLARHLGIPMKISQALERLFTSRIILMDAFRMNGNLSLNVSGVGFDGHIAFLFSVDKKRGFYTYTRLALLEFLRFQQFDAQITIAGTVVNKKAFVIAIANSSQYGNNARIAPAASVCDELLHVSILRKMPVYRLDVIYSFFSGNIGQSPYCEILEARDLIIELPSSVPFHIDGEPAGKADRFVIELIPGAVKMLAPEGMARC